MSERITSKKPKMLFLGPGRSGKDECCDYLSKLTGLANAGTSSRYLAKYVAAELGVPEEEAYARRRESDAMRVVWYEIGNKIRADDPSLLCREMFSAGDIGGGLRSTPEIVAVRREQLADLIIWVERDVPTDPTMDFGSEYADIVIQNNGTKSELYAKLIRLAMFAGLPTNGASDA